MNYNFEISYHKIVCSVTLQNGGNVSLFDPFAHTNQDADSIRNFDFVRGESKEEKEKVRIEGAYCTVVTIGEKFLERKIFNEVMKKIDDIRKMIRTYFIIRGRGSVWAIKYLNYELLKSI